MTADVLAGTSPAPAGRRSRATALRIGTVLALVVVSVALLAPVLSVHDPYQQDLAKSFAGSSGEHWLGTDQLGRDLLARLLYGLRLDLRIAVTAVALTFLVGLVLGCLAGYGPPWLDAAIMRLGDAVIAFPTLVVLLTLVFVLGPGEFSIYIWAVSSRLGALRPHPAR